MPELPEVETIRRGLEPLITRQFISDVKVRERRLRWPVTRNLAGLLRGQQILQLGRRAKYLLIKTSSGTLLVHLGMSGSLFYLPSVSQPTTHDHIDISFRGGSCLRFNDPRRFGSIHFTTQPKLHRLLTKLGPEPLGKDFSTEYLTHVSRSRRVAIKNHLMNGQIIAGLGNIYATEALFRAGIHPARPAGRISAARFSRLVQAIREILNEAIRSGGTTLKDFVGGDGRPGFFQQSLSVYGRSGDPCFTCGVPIKRITQGQRSSYYCPRCQR